MDTHRPSTKQCMASQTYRLMFLTIISMAFATSVVGAASDGQCFKPVPGVSKMFRGVDITQFDPTPPDFTTDDGYKSPVIKFTCNEGRKLRIESKNYQVPDQIWHVDNKPGGSLTEKVNLYKSVSDVQSSKGYDVQAQGWIKYFGFSATRSYMMRERTITEAAKYISDVSSFYSSKQAAFRTDGSLQLSAVAKSYLKSNVGNQTYRSNPQAYQEFINQFGTHFFSVANFGGLIWSVYEIEIKFFQSHTDEEAKNNARASLQAWLLARGGNKDHTQSDDSMFSGLSTETVRFYGGSANLLSSEGIQTWQPTVDANPWLFSGELKAISDLIQGETRRTSMEEAVQQHILRAYLGELRRLMDALTLRKSTAVSEHLRKIEDNLADMEALPQGALVEKDVENLGLLINQQWEFEQSKRAAQPTPSEDSENVGSSKDSSSKDSSNKDSSSKNNSSKNSWDLSFIAICMATLCYIQVFLRNRH